jgi:hypothetical protein
MITHADPLKLGGWIIRSNLLVDKPTRAKQK